MWSTKRNSARKAVHGLDRATEAELSYRNRELGDINARNELVESHLSLVKRMARFYVFRGAIFEDLVQEGCLGLMRAVRSFEPKRNVRFATYAAFWIRSYMQRHLASIRSHQYSAPASVAYSGGRSRGHAGRRELLRTTSLDAPVHANSELTLVESLASASCTPEESVERLESCTNLRKALLAAFDELDDQRTVVVIKKRLLSDDPATLAAIGKELNLSREGARLLELRLIKRTEAHLRLAEEGGPQHDLMLCARLAYA